MTVEERKEYLRKYYLKNKQYRIKLNNMSDNEKKEWEKKIKKKYCKKYSQKEILKQYTEKEKKEIKIIKEKKRKEKNNKYYKNKRQIDPLYKLSCTLRVRIATALKAKLWNKINTTKDILGCEFKTAKLHLENQFIDGMSWDNHGLFGWHIDHIIPLASAKTEEELYKLCHYTNLQPLWAEDNLKKSDKIN